MTTAQDQQSREAYEDGKWYWVEHEGWHGEPPTIAPACYKAECDAWYSYIFSGISTPYLKVLEPCELQAARALPAGMEPVAWVDMAQWPPIRWPAGSVRADFRDIDGMALFTAAQVQAMGRVPPGWQAVPVEPTEEQLAAVRQKPHPANPNGWDVNHRRIYREMLAAAPRPPDVRQGLQVTRIELTPEQRKSLQADCKGPLPPAAMGGAQTPATGASSVTAGAAPAYRLLQPGVDTIQATDEVLADDVVTWKAVGRGIFAGMTYIGAMLPVRRALNTGP